MVRHNATYLMLSMLILCTTVGCYPAEKSPRPYVRHIPDDSFKVLVEAKCFRTGGIGPGGVTSDEEFSLRRIMVKDDASVTLDRLFTEGTPVGKLYALLGLRFVNRARYNELVPQMRQDTRSVDEQGGCIISETTVKDIVASIEKGEHDDDILRKDTHK